MKSSGSPLKSVRHAALILSCGIGIILLSAIWLALTGNTDIRYSADHESTVPVWTKWIPSLIGLIVIRLIPPSLQEARVDPLTDYRPIAWQTWVLLAAALLFPVLLALTGDTEGWYAAIKLVLLVAVPLAVFRLTKSATRLVQAHSDAQRSDLGRWYWLGPILPLVAWFYLTYATPLATPTSDYVWPDVVTLVVTVIIVFLINAVVEEMFYRVWLQSRLELLLGRWPAIVLASLVWAVWHVVIQGGRGLDIDLATAFSNQGVQGLFLGYLWSRYRNIWVLLIVHGAINALGILIALL